MPKMSEKPEQPKPSERVRLIGAVKTYLGFFVLVVLIVEAVLGAIALKSQGKNQTYALFGMLFVIVILIAVVSFFAYRRPDVLLHSMTGRPAPEIRRLHDFCDRVSGDWWEKIIPIKTSALSSVELQKDPGTGTIKMKGSAFSRDGKLVGHWESVACCINPNDRTLFYYWKGSYSARPNVPYEGFGEISFRESSHHFESGSGTYSDTNVKKMRSTTKRSIEFRRSTEAEKSVIQKGNEKEISDLVRKKLRAKP